MITRRSFLNGMMTSASGLALTAAGLPLFGESARCARQPLDHIAGSVLR